MTALFTQVGAKLGGFMAGDKFFIIVGQNPPNLNCAKIPFTETQSSKRLTKWLSNAGIDPKNVEVINAVDSIKKSGSRISNREIGAAIEKKMVYNRIKKYCHIVTLGQVAYEVVDKSLNKYWEDGQTSRHHIIYKLPHPSGLNRTLNNANTASAIQSIFEALAKLTRNVPC